MSVTLFTSIYLIPAVINCHCMSGNDNATIDKHIKTHQLVFLMKMTTIFRHKFGCEAAHDDITIVKWAGRDFFIEIIEVDLYVMDEDYGCVLKKLSNQKGHEYEIAA